MPHLRSGLAGQLTMELIEVGRGAGVRVNAVDSRRVTIGRNPDNDVVVSDPSVSRHHAMLELVDSAWRLRDLGSRNGTYLNGSRVDRVVRVQSGDRIEVGDSTFRLGEPAPDSRPDLATRRPNLSNDTVHLTPREREVLRRLAEGATDEQIAQAMTLSIRTVQSHLDRIRDKTGLRRRPELTRYAIKIGLAAGE